MAKTPVWQRKAGQNPNGGLNEAGRRSLKAEGHDIKRPQPEGGPRKKSFCARMEGAKAKLTSKETANDPDSRINKSLRKWKCADGGAVDPYDSVQQAAKGGPIWDKPRPKKLGKPEPLSSKEKASAKAAAKAAGRPYPNLIDNMRAARADGGPADDRAHEFVQEQLKSGETQAPQYVAENDFPTRAARGVEAIDTAASRVNNMLANVAGQPAMRSQEGRSASEIVQSAMPVDPYQAVQQAARQWHEGDRLGAAETMATATPMQGMIKSRIPEQLRGMSDDDIAESLRMARQIIPAKNPRLMWHGSGSGELVGGRTGLHLGTYNAAKQALEAHLGVPAEGEWIGTREWGKTPLAGRERMLEIDPRGYLRTGYNVDAPAENYLPVRPIKYASGENMPADVRPSILPYRITGEMVNQPYSPYEDFAANARMAGLLTRGNARRGIYYENIGEDPGSISAVVPGGSHVEPIDLKSLLETGKYAHGGEVVNDTDPYDNIRLKAKNFPRARRASH